MLANCAHFLHTIGRSFLHPKLKSGQSKARGEILEKLELKLKEQSPKTVHRRASSSLTLSLQFEKRKREKNNKNSSLLQLDLNLASRSLPDLRLCSNFARDLLFSSKAKWLLLEVEDEF